MPAIKSHCCCRLFGWTLDSRIVLSRLSVNTNWMVGTFPAAGSRVALVLCTPFWLQSGMTWHGANVVHWVAIV